MLLERDGYARTLGYLEPEFFYQEPHRFIYESITALYREGWGLDLVTVTHALRKKGITEIDGQSAAYFLTMLTRPNECVVWETHLEQWCVILRELYMEREMRRIESTAGSGDGDAVEKAMRLKEMLDRAINFKAQDDWRDLSEVMLTLSAHREKVKGKDLLGISTGIKTLDTITAGLQPTQLIVVGARPSVGKSAFATGMAIAAAKAGHSVGIVSLEMPEEQIGSRIASIYTDIEFWRIYRNKHSDANEEQRLLDAMPDIAGLPIYISDKTSVTGGGIRAKTEKLMRRKGCDLILIDYLQLIESEGKEGGNREREVAKLSRSLKLMAMDLKIPVVVLCQLNRESEKQGSASKKPKMSQIRESGAIEQDADIVLLLDYPYKRGETTDENGNSTLGKANIILEKNRNGETLDVPVTFSPELMKFSEPDPFDQPQAPKPFDDPRAGINPNRNFESGREEPLPF